MCSRLDLDIKHWYLVPRPTTAFGTKDDGTSVGDPNPHGSLLMVGWIWIRIQVGKNDQHKMKYWMFAFEGLSEEKKKKFQLFSQN
jgi:hypothetical protein